MSCCLDDLSTILHDPQNRPHQILSSLSRRRQKQGELGMFLVCIYFKVEYQFYSTSLQCWIDRLSHGLPSAKLKNRQILRTPQFTISCIFPASNQSKFVQCHATLASLESGTTLSDFSFYGGTPRYPNIIHPGML